MYPENPEETRVILGSMNMEYVSDPSSPNQDSNPQPVSS